MIPCYRTGSIRPRTYCTTKYVLNEDIPEVYSLIAVGIEIKVLARKWM